MTQTLYCCSYSDCSNYGIVRAIAEDGNGNPLSPAAIICAGSLSDVPGTTCGRILDRLPQGVGGPIEHTPSTTPVSTYTPPQPQPDIATAADHTVVSDAIRSQKLAAIPISREALPTILENLLGEAAAAIPFFEKYAHDSSMSSPQWTAFQALDQTTKDRLLYDLLRSVAALMRYLTGELPTA